MHFSFTVALAALAASLALPAFATPTPDAYYDIEARDYDLNDFVSRDDIAGELLMRENAMDNMLVARVVPFNHYNSHPSPTSDPRPPTPPQPHDPKPRPIYVRPGDLEELVARLGARDEFQWWE